MRAVPEAGRKPDDEEVEDHALAAAAAAAERDIQILAEPRAERDVPAPPELRHAQRQIRAAEVLRDVEAQHPADADGHERVAPEVKIELERIRDRGHPRKRRREALEADRGHIAPEAAELVCQQHLERHAEQKQLEPVDRLTQRHIAHAEFRLQLRIARDRAGDQLREHGQVRAEREQRALRRDRAAVDVHEIAHRRERVEADADRQRPAQQRDRRLAAGHEPEHTVDAGEHEVEILKQEQPQEVVADAEDEPQLRARLVAHDGQTQPVVDQHRCGQQRKIRPLTVQPDDIKHAASHQQHDIARAGRPRRCQIVHQQKRRKEAKQKRQAAENHGPFSS